MNNEDDYNVNNYTDNELYDILELVNPSDSILEAKIIQMINKFKTMNNRYGHTLVTFFTNIYKHFFDVPMDEDEIEGFENIESKKYDKTTKKFIEDTNAPDGIAFETEPDLSLDIQNKPNEQQLIPGFSSTTNPIQEKNTRSFKEIDYVKGTINPLLKQTIKRIISIDSQYREGKDKISTEFTFNLSEPLRDVVALRLYSIQIPFTWYTVGNNYGANYLYFKGNSPGIDNGLFDYKIEIPPGNYTNQTLVNTVNTGFQSLKTQYTDVSFGTTQITYNTETCKSTITTDIKNLFNESNYEIVFPNDASLNNYPLLDLSGNKTTTQNNQLRYSTASSDKRTSLFAYLGFDKHAYRVNAIYSNAKSLSTLTYTISSNNTCTIKRRDSNNDVISDNITITIPPGTYNESGIIQAINNDISNNSRLERTSSSIVRKVITDLSKANTELYYYEMHIYFNKQNDPFANVSGLTTYIVFPNETTTPLTNTIWTGTDSLFNFNTYNNNTQSYNDFNEIIAESESYQTDYIINTSPYIVLKCINIDLSNSTTYSPLGNGMHNNQNGNDFIIDISNSTASTGYNFTEYLSAIKNKLNIPNPNNYDLFQINNDISYNSTTNKVDFTFNMNIGFYKNKYKIKLGTIFTTLGSFDTNYTNLIYDLSATKVAFQQPTLEANDLIATIQPNATDSIYGGESWEIRHINTRVPYSNIDKLIEVIQTQFINFQAKDGSKPIKEMKIDYTATNITLKFNIIRQLTQKDYKVYFNDASGNENLWEKYLFFDTSYNLNSALYNSINNNTIISSNSKVGGYTFYMDRDISFNIHALTSGITSPKNENDIIITIPKPTSSNNTYTRQEIFNIINQQFEDNPVTRGSKIYYQINAVNKKQYVQLKIKINKMFTAKDYNVVMYDPYSFVKCFVGTKSVRNVTWDSTLGWLLGFRNRTQYDLINTTEYSTNSYTLDQTTNIITITSDTTMTTNIYDYFLIILDDYTQSHLNDGLVTVIPKDRSISLPSYAQTIACNNGTKIVTDTTGTVNGLTANQLYAANEILNQSNVANKSYSTGPYIQDVFGIVPLKLGIPAGSTYVEFGGTLQNQERVYFGPVNISRMTIKLINDRGEPVDLNGADWSFSFICEQLY